LVAVAVGAKAKSWFWTKNIESCGLCAVAVSCPIS
jgi:hypothetical protein